MRDGRSAALGNANDPRRAVRQQAIAVLCEAEKPDLEQVRSQRVLLMGDSQKNLPAADCARAYDAAVWASSPSTAPAATPVPVWVEKWSFKLDADGNPVLDENGDPIPASTGRGRRPPPREPDGGALTALVYAARTGSIDAARVLLEGGADVNQTTRYGWSPLLAATQNQNYQMAKFLIEHGANVNLANKGGWTPLYLATDNRNIEGGDYPTRTADMDSLAYITYLLDKGANVNARITESTETRTVFTNQWLNEEGATAFLRAAQSGDLELLKLLKARGADPKINTRLGVTPLAVAAGIGWVESVTREHSPAETVETVKYLLSLGIDPNFQADTGRVALHGAAHKGATEVVKVLVAAGARMDVRDFVFIDVGMGLSRKNGPISGMMRATYFPDRHAQQVRDKGLAPLADQPDDVYKTNIQISELNALNAALAMVRYKQFKGFYLEDDANCFNLLFGLTDCKVITRSGLNEAQ